MSLLRRRAPLLLTILAIVAIGTVGYLLTVGRAQAPKYRTVKVDRGPVTPAVSATGALNAVTTVLVGSQVSGQIKDLYVDYNSLVKKGQLVARLDPDPFQAKVNGNDRDLEIRLVGPALSGFKIITPADKEEADVIWVLDMMNQLGTSQHNAVACSVTPKQLYARLLDGAPVPAELRESANSWRAGGAVFQLAFSLDREPDPARPIGPDARLALSSRWRPSAPTR